MYRKHFVVISSFFAFIIFYNPQFLLHNPHPSSPFFDHPFFLKFHQKNYSGNLFLPLQAEMRLVVWSNGMIYTLLYMLALRRGDGQEKNNYYITNNKLTLMKMEKEMKYEAPEVEVLEVEIEAGFQASGDFNIEDGD